MATILNFEAAQCERLAGYNDTLGAVQACDELRRHFMGEVPMADHDLTAALAIIQRLACPHSDDPDAQAGG